MSMCQDKVNKISLKELSEAEEYISTVVVIYDDAEVVSTECCGNPQEPQLSPVLLQHSLI